MKPRTRKELLERIDILEGLFSSHMLRPLREELFRERDKVTALKKTLAEESTDKQYWEDCAKKLMLENEFLKNGKEGCVRDPAAALEPKYMRRLPKAPWLSRLKMRLFGPKLP